MKKSNYIWLALLIIGTALVLLRHNGFISWGEEKAYRNEKGLIFGTMYNITYEYDKSLKLEIDKELNRFDASLSMFNDSSVISRVNRNEDFTVDSLFTNVFRRAMKISETTDGSFDITVAPLVNAWGFGFTESINPSQEKIDSLLLIVGWQKIQLSNENKIIKHRGSRKDDPAIFFRQFFRVLKIMQIEGIITQFLLPARSLDILSFPRLPFAIAVIGRNAGDQDFP